MNTSLSRIKATGRDTKEIQAAEQAAIEKAAICLSSCPHCQQVLATAPETRRMSRMKITASMCQVRTQCELQPQPVRPPQDAIEYGVCPIKTRALLRATA